MRVPWADHSTVGALYRLVLVALLALRDYADGLIAPSSILPYDLSGSLVRGRLVQVIREHPRIRQISGTGGSGAQSVSRLITQGQIDLGVSAALIVRIAKTLSLQVGVPPRVRGSAHMRAQARCDARSRHPASKKEIRSQWASRALVLAGATPSPRRCSTSGPASVAPG